MLRTLALCALSMSALHAAEAKPFHWRGTIAAGKSLEVRGVNGNITVDASSGSSAEVDGVITARRSDPSQVRVEVEQRSGNVLLCVIYPSSPGGCDARQSTKENDTQVNFTVKLPKDVRLVARTVNGNVNTTKLQSPVDAKSVNGSIEITTTQTATAETVNGTIRASMGRLQPDAKFTSVNGNVELGLPANAGANLNASTVNGSIEPDFAVTLTGKISKRQLNGRLGEGGSELVIKTVNGSIRIRKNTFI